MNNNGKIKIARYNNQTNLCCIFVLIHIKYIIKMDFLATHNLLGLVIGLTTFLVIGLFHPIVIKAHYYWGTGCWWLFLLMGIIGVVLSLIVSQVLWSAVLGVFSFSSFWSIKELFEQEQRVLKGWFPANPKRK